MNVQDKQVSAHDKQTIIPASGPYFDMHCHLDFASNGLEAAEEIQALGAGAFSVSVLPATEIGDGTPISFLSKSGTGVPSLSSPTGVPSPAAAPVASPATASLVRWGMGLHPWWVADGRAGNAERDAIVAAIAQHTYIGEVGLDFGKTHGLARAEQVEAFEAIVRACGEVGGRVLSIHAVNAAGEVLDILSRYGVLDNGTCIFHWYSGSGEAFTRAVRAGCSFSVGQPMLQTKRGREYARQIPLDQLLLETDAPGEGEAYCVAARQAELAQVCAHIAALREIDAAVLATQIAATSYRILSN